MRYFAVAYLGWAYHGSQRQPDVRTVEGEIEGALARMGIRSRARLLSRTDAGVSARKNIMVLSGDLPLEAVEGLNDKLEDIRIWGYFEGMPRILWREYWYLVSGVEPRELERGISILSSLRDLGPFHKGPGRPGEVEMGIRPGEPTVIWFRSKYFLWQMVRRMVSFILEVAEGADQEVELKKAVEAGGYKPADPRFLILWDTSTHPPPRPMDPGSWPRDLFLRSRILSLLSEGLGLEG